MQEKEKQMLLDYPEAVNKLTLLILGMTVKSGRGEKMVSDYEEQKKSLGANGMSMKK